MWGPASNTTTHPSPCVHSCYCIELVLVPFYSQECFKHNNQDVCPCSFLPLQVSELLEAVNMYCAHVCRGEPHQAAIYSLRGTGADLERFEANFRADLTLEEEDLDGHGGRSQTKTKSSKLELPLRFRQQDVQMVNKK